MSALKQNIKMPTYQEIVENLTAAEGLEWEATNLYDISAKRKAHLHYFSLGGIVTLIGVYFAYMYDLTSNIHSELLMLALFAGIIVIFLGVYIFMKEGRAVKSLFEEAEFRRQLALELVRPIRDILYLAAEKQSFSEFQVTSLQIRLSRFPIDEQPRNKEKKKHE